MTLSRDHVGGLIFLVLSIAYGYYTQQIPLLPGDEYEPFTARTLPGALAVAGAVLAFLQIVTATPGYVREQISHDWYYGLVGRLMLLVVAFAIALKWLGFMLSTILFLVCAYRMLGERRPKTLFLASVPFAVGLWLVLTQLLNIYLAPGQLFTLVTGG